MVIVVGVVTAVFVVLSGAESAALEYHQQARETCADLPATIGQLDKKATAIRVRAETVLDQLRESVGNVLKRVITPLGLLIARMVSR